MEQIYVQMSYIIIVNRRKKKMCPQWTQGGINARNYNRKHIKPIQNSSRRATKANIRSNSKRQFKKEEISPVVGDVVEIEIVDEEKKTAVNKQNRRKKSICKRPKLANITQIVFVVSSKDPKPDLLMLDKQLVFAEFLGIKAIIVLNKTDLDKDKQFMHIKEVYEKVGYTVIETEAKSQKGVEELKQALTGNINAFSGNSGVGKSTLINAIFNTDVTQEGEISKKK